MRLLGAIQSDQENQDEWDDFETAHLLRDDEYERLLRDLQTGGDLEIDDVYDQELHEPNANRIYGDDYYTIDRVRQMYNKKFNHTITDYKIRFRNLTEDIVQLQDIFRETLIDIINASGGASRNIYMQFVILHPSLEIPITTPYIHGPQLTPEMINDENGTSCTIKKGLETRSTTHNSYKSLRDSEWSWRFRSIR